MKTYHDLPGDGGSRLLEQVREQRARLAARMGAIRRKLAVVSGKGGVGKSALCANLAAELSARGLRVGALDADLNGPTLARMLGAEKARVEISKHGAEPVSAASGVRLFSVGVLIPEGEFTRWRAPVQADSFIWRGTAEAETLREFLSDVAWGELDFLLLDLPPGTDRISTLLQLLPDCELLIVTAPSAAAQTVVARSLSLAKEEKAVVAGVVENLSGLFPGEPNARELAACAGVRFLGSVPYDPDFTQTTDRGAPAVRALPHSPAARAISELADQLLAARAVAEPPAR